MPISDHLRDEACEALGAHNPRPLKEGGQKSVFLVDVNGDTLVLKAIEVTTSAPDAIRRAEREVQLLRDVDSPHVVKVASDLVELGDPLNGVAWLEEALDGDDLDGLVGQPWPWVEAARLGIELGRGLGALHARRVVHRDLSPRNVRRRVSGVYVVMDPGYARHELRSGLTIGGHPGTPGYASPEHIAAYSGSPTPFSDVFCIGILLYLALTGEVPIPYRGDEADYLRRLSSVAVEPVETLRTDLAKERHAVVARCLHPQPARRFRNGDAVADALEVLT